MKYIILVMLMSLVFSQSSMCAVATWDEEFESSCSLEIDELIAREQISSNSEETVVENELGVEVVGEGDLHSADAVSGIPYLTPE